MPLHYNRLLAASVGTCERAGSLQALEFLLAWATKSAEAPLAKLTRRYDIHSQLCSQQVPEKLQRVLPSPGLLLSHGGSSFFQGAWFLRVFKGSQQDKLHLGGPREKKQWGKPWSVFGEVLFEGLDCDIAPRGAGSLAIWFVDYLRRARVCAHNSKLSDKPTRFGYLPARSLRLVQSRPCKRVDHSLGEKTSRD